jgi:hypothetical protein
LVGPGEQRSVDGIVWFDRSHIKGPLARSVCRQDCGKSEYAGEDHFEYPRRTAASGFKHIGFRYIASGYTCQWNNHNPVLSVAMVAFRAGLITATVPQFQGPDSLVRIPF